MRALPSLDQRLGCMGVKMGRGQAFSKERGRLRAGVRRGLRKSRSCDLGDLRPRFHEPLFQLRKASRSSFLASVGMGSSGNLPRALIV